MTLINCEFDIPFSFFSRNTSNAISPECFSYVNIAYYGTISTRSTARYKSNKKIIIINITIGTNNVVEKKLFFSSLVFSNRK